ncbi:ABC-type phosphate transport system permease subunit [Staphylococcus hominis]
MNIKEIIEQAYYDLLSLKVNWFNGIMLLLIVSVLSGIVTPFIGVPIGLLGGGYILKRYEEKKALNP